MTYDIDALKAAMDAAEVAYQEARNQEHRARHHRDQARTNYHTARVRAAGIVLGETYLEVEAPPKTWGKNRSMTGGISYYLLKSVVMRWGTAEIMGGRVTKGGKVSELATESFLLEHIIAGEDSGYAGQKTRYRVVPGGQVQALFAWRALTEPQKEMLLGVAGTSFSEWRAAAEPKNHRLTLKTLQKKGLLGEGQPVLTAFGRAVADAGAGA